MRLAVHPDIDDMKNDKNVRRLRRATGCRRNWEVREAASDALGKLGDPRTVKRAWVRAYAAEALGKLGDRGAVDALRAVLTDEDSFVRATAAAALDELGPGPDDTAAGAAYWVATKQWGRCVETGAIAPLIGALDDEDPAVRGGVTGALVDIGPEAVRPLVDALQNPHMTLRGRSAAAEALGRIGDVRAVEPLLTLLGDRGIGVRRAAAEALGRLGDTRGIEPLVNALTDHDEDVRTAAAEALQRLGWRPEGTVAEAAFWVATHQWDEAVRLAAVEPLIMALQDRAASVREPAADALGTIGDARAIAPLSAALSDPDLSVAKAAARALVAMYASGKLDQAQKAEVLALRGRITFRDDVPEHEGVDVRDDRSIGVDFPI